MNGPPPLTGEEGRLLLAAARQAVSAALRGDPLPVPDQVPPRLLQPQGVFVSLRNGNVLRGCIGVIPALDPLIRAVVQCAAGAALEDPRFPPVGVDEAAGLTFEVSVIEAPREVRDLEEIEIGRHGLLISEGRRRGLLLPQVATEHGWDRATFLREACRKANLDPDAWQRSARIEVFGAQIISERATD